MNKILIIVIMLLNAHILYSQNAASRSEDEARKNALAMQKDMEMMLHTKEAMTSASGSMTHEKAIALSEAEANYRHAVEVAKLKAMMQQSQAAPIENNNGMLMPQSTNWREVETKDFLEKTKKYKRGEMTPAEEAAFSKKIKHDRKQQEAAYWQQWQVEQQVEKGEISNEQARDDWQQRHDRTDGGYTSQERLSGSEDNYKLNRNNSFSWP